MDIPPKLFVSLLLAVGIGLGISSCFKEDYEALDFAKAVTERYNQINATSVRLFGRVEGINGNLANNLYPQRNHGFLFSETDDSPTIGGAGIQSFAFGTFSQNQSFEQLIEGLRPGVTYYFRAFVELGDRTNYGDTREIRLDDNFLISLSDSITIYNNRALFSGGTFFRNFEIELADLGFVYAATGQAPVVGIDPTISLGPTDDDGGFSALSGPLAFNSTYQLRAYAKLDNEIIYSEGISFATTDGWRRVTILDNRVILYSVGAATQEAAFVGLGCVDEVCQRNNSSSPWWSIMPVGDTVTWSEQPNFPNLRRGDAVSFSINGKIYYGMGRVSGAGAAIDRVFNDIWEYDPVQMQWTFMDNFPGEPRSHAVAFVLDGKAYVGTGLVADEFGNEFELGDFWIFDPTAPLGSQWAAEPIANPLPVKLGDDIYYEQGVRRSAAAFTLRGKAYVGGGVVQGAELSDFWEFDPATQQWTLQTDAVFPGRIGAVAISADDKAYFGLGLGDGDEPLYDFWEFDPNRGSGADAWKRLKDFPQSSVYPEAIRPPYFMEPTFGLHLQGQLFVGGPNTNFFSTDIWEYIPQN